jgi:hypothetical protein
MSAEKNNAIVPDGYVRLEGSERRASTKAKLIGPVDDNERFSVTIVLRRRADGPPFPDFDYFTRTPPRRRMRLSHEEFTEQYGAHPGEIHAIEKFAKKHGLTVKSSHAGRRHVVVEGTAAKFSAAFGVSFNRYELPPAPRRKNAPPRRTGYRGREGFIHVPKELAESIVGVFGLDNRPISRRNGEPGDTPIANLISVAQASLEYNLPAPGASVGGQTIGIVSADAGYVGFLQSDINQTYSAIGRTAPLVHQISPEGASVTNHAFSMATNAPASVGGTSLSFASASDPRLYIGSEGFYVFAGTLYFLQVMTINPTSITFTAWDGSNWVSGFQSQIPNPTTIAFNLDGETTQDLSIAGLAALGANLACYFISGTQASWVALMGRVLHPVAGDFPAGVNPPSVLSTSYYIAPGDDPDGLAQNGVTTALLDAVSQAFQDATILANGPTICVATGDFGSNCGVGSEIGAPTQGDGYAHVQYPASDPWVLGVGGTTLGQYLPSGSMTPQPVEFAWNAPFLNPDYPWGAGGGGVSDYFPLPSYQSEAGVPNSVNPGITTPTPSTVTPPAPFNATGRGVPDVAANANIDTGFSGIALAGVLGAQTGNGTSASAPFWAGVMALLNSNAGVNIGFANPTLYTLGASAFNPINPLWPDPAYPQLATCPANNSNSGIPGYPTHAGWDAVTGLGSPNGMAILSGFEALDTVYILGGYQSPDIILTDLTTSQPVPIGGLPGGRWDTLLEPSTNYGFSANINNDGPTAANGVVVSFWAIPGGVGTNGTMVGVPQTVDIPAYSTVPVNASAPFTSAPPGDHLCAVVSLYNPSTGCSVDATNALEIPSPGYSMTHQCSAWRNTDSMLAGPGRHFGFHIGLGVIPFHLEEPVQLGIETKHVPATWQQTPVARGIANTLRAVGAKSNLPLYLLPGLRQSFATVAVESKVKAKHGLEVKEREPGVWLLRPEGKAETTSFEISGTVPADAKPGDVLLVNVTATYPRIKGRAARTIEFLEFVHVSDRKRER